MSDPVRRALNPASLPAEHAERTRYSYGVQAGDTVYVSGQVAFAPDGTIVGEGDVAAQVEQAFTNLAAVLAEAGGTMADVVATTTYLVDVADSPVVSAARARWFTGEVLPTHTVIGVAALARPAFLVEISAVAVLRG